MGDSKFSSLGKLSGCEHRSLTFTNRSTVLVEYGRVSGREEGQSMTLNMIMLSLNAPGNLSGEIGKPLEAGLRA